MSYRIGLQFEDGLTRFINCRSGESVADAAYRQGVRTPIDCREGACGTCKCHIESGIFALGDYAEDALAPAEVAQGFGLTCQMRPQSDGVVAFQVESTVCQVAPSRLDVTVAELERLSSSTYRLRVQSPSLQTLFFLPGQYAHLHLPDGSGFRAYSFSSLCGPDHTIQFLIRNVPGGAMSTWLESKAQPGDALTLTAPYGAFYLRPVQRPVLMLAGGTGLGPFLAMLESMCKADVKAQFPVHLMLGVNTPNDLVGLHELNQFAEGLPHFTYEVCMLSPDGLAGVKQGYVTDHLDRERLHDGDVDLYLCGPPAMVDAVVTGLNAKCLKTRGFYHERFSAGH